MEDRFEITIKQATEKLYTNIIQINLLSSLVGIYLFGSVAQGNHKGSSDVDILVLFKSNTMLSLMEKGILYSVIDDFIYPKIDVVLVTEDDLKSNNIFYENINKTKYLLKNNEGES